MKEIPEAEWRPRVNRWIEMGLERADIVIAVDAADPERWKIVRGDEVLQAIHSMGGDFKVLQHVMRVRVDWTTDEPEILEAACQVFHRKKSNMPEGR